MQAENKDYAENKLVVLLFSGKFQIQYSNIFVYSGVKKRNGL